MRNTLSLVLICMVFLSLNCYSQELTLSELTSLQDKNLDFINNFLSKKKWEFNSSNVNNTESLEDYTTVGWSLNQTNYDDNLADAWFYLYQRTGSEHIISYLTTKSTFNKFKNAAEKSGYKLLNTEAVEGGLKTKYRNNKLELIFTTRKSEDYSDEFTSYGVMVYNYVKVEEQIKQQEELEKKEAEAKLKLELENKAKEEKYSELISQANNLYKQKNFSASKNAYLEALKIKPDASYPSEKVAEIDKLAIFLSERTTKTYNLADVNKIEYNAISSQIQNESNNLTKNVKPSSFFISGVLKIEIDTNNVVKFNTESLKRDDESQLNSLLANLKNTIKPSQQQLFGYNIKTEFTYTFDISYLQGETSFKIDKSHKINYSDREALSDVVISEIEKKYKSSEIGKYSISYELFSNENNQQKKNMSVLKYRKPINPTYYAGIALIVGGIIYGVTK